jgi:hypothetical protein
MVVRGIDMQVTDEMVRVAACVYLGKPRDCTLPSGNIDDMRKALEAAIQAAWVKFDIDDESTHPNDQKDVLVDFGCYLEVACLRSNSTGIAWSDTGDNRFINSAKYWMPLPEFKEHS